MQGMQEADAVFETISGELADDANADIQTKDADKESAAHEKRAWVRLTSYCNNRCTFCLDSAAHNGTFGSRLEIRTQIIDGRKNGATRLILSGGEPTIHPNYVEFIRLGRQLGYRKIQTVTNGRLFAYPKFMSSCLDAGLSEITFSIHGHNAKVHDALVGVPGAFEEEVRGLQAALDDGRPIVNIDVCLNKGNIAGLPKLLDRFLAMGVGEYDLLHIIPFGRAFEEGRRSLFYDLDEAMPSIQYALEVSERPDVHIWFNRFPPPYLEGHEELIQDPYKLGDEVRGRKEEYDRWIDHGQPISCREPERCARCYLSPLCGSLEQQLDSLAKQQAEILRLDLRDQRPLPSELPGHIQTLWLITDTIEAAAGSLSSLPSDTLVLELEQNAIPDLSSLRPGSLEGRVISKIYVNDPSSLDSLLAPDFDAAPDSSNSTAFEVVARLDKAMADHLLKHWPQGHPRLVFAGKRFERLTEERELGADLARFFEAFNGTYSAVEEIPACLSGRSPRRPLPILDSRSLDANGRTDIYGFTTRYIQDGFLTKSHRCSACRYNTECEGAHVNYIRARGYSQLKPVSREPKGNTQAA